MILTRGYGDTLVVTRGYGGATGIVPISHQVIPTRQRPQHWNALERNVLRMIGEDDGQNDPMDRSQGTVTTESATTKEWTALERKLLRLVGGIHE